MLVLGIFNSRRVDLQIQTILLAGFLIAAATGRLFPFLHDDFTSPFRFLPPFRPLRPPPMLMDPVDGANVKNALQDDIGIPSPPEMPSKTSPPINIFIVTGDHDAAKVAKVRVRCSFLHKVCRFNALLAFSASAWTAAFVLLARGLNLNGINR